MKRATLILAALVLCGEGLAGAEVTYDTTPSWNGSDYIYYWGPPQGTDVTGTYGQTFVAPSTDNVLQNFTFYLTGLGNGESVTFQADVYAWSGSLTAGNSPQGSTGAPLFTSSNMTFTDNGAFQAITVNTSGLTLTPGADYVALFTTSDPASLAANGDSTNSFAFGEINGGSHVSDNGGGGFNFYNNPLSSQLATPPWDDNTDYGDLAWNAHFTQGVPEPSTLRSPRSADSRCWFAGGATSLAGSQRPWPVRATSLWPGHDDFLVYSNLLWKVPKFDPLMALAAGVRNLLHSVLPLRRAAARRCSGAIAGRHRTSGCGDCRRRRCTDVRDCQSPDRGGQGTGRVLFPVVRRSRAGSGRRW